MCRPRQGQRGEAIEILAYLGRHSKNIVLKFYKMTPHSARVWVYAENEDSSPTDGTRCSGSPHRPRLRKGTNVLSRLYVWSATGKTAPLQSARRSFCDQGPFFRLGSVRLNSG